MKDKRLDLVFKGERRAEELLGRWIKTIKGESKEGVDQDKRKQIWSRERKSCDENEWMNKLKKELRKEERKMGRQKRCLKVIKK